MKTLSEVKQDVLDVIKSTHWLQTRLEALKARGYAVTYNWVKNGEIGDIWHIKRKDIYRIQVSESEKQGDFEKAYCIEVPAKDVCVLASETAMVRSTPISLKKWNEIKK